MPRVLTNGEVKIGAYKFPDRKKPCICVEKGNAIYTYGTFKDEKLADMFMTELGNLVGAKME